MKKKPVKHKPGTLERRAEKKKAMNVLSKAGKDIRKKISKGMQQTAAARAALEGNRFWIARSKHGRDKIFASPHILLEAAFEYFEYTDKVPMFTKKEWKSERGKLKLVELPLPNVYTLEGLCIFLDVNTNYFNTFRRQLKADDPQAHDFNRVIAWILDTIRQNKFAGASNGMFSTSLIALDLGLKSDSPVINQGLVVQVSDSSKAASLLDDVKKKLDDLDKEKES